MTYFTILLSLANLADTQLIMSIALYKFMYIISVVSFLKRQIMCDVTTARNILSK